jgi:hypothetical protein
VLEVNHLQVVQRLQPRGVAQSRVSHLSSVFPRSIS